MRKGVTENHENADFIPHFKKLFLCSNIEIRFLSQA